MVLSSKMPDFELEPVRLSSQDKTLDEKFAGNLQREERQPETEFNQVVGGVLAPLGPTSSSSPKSTRVPCIGEGRRRRGKVGQRKRGHPWGVEVFTTPLWTRPSLFLANCQRKWKWSVLVLWSTMIFVSSLSDTMWLGRKAEKCYGCLRGENKYKFEVLSFEKGWDKIQSDTPVLLKVLFSSF